MSLRDPLLPSLIYSALFFLLRCDRVNVGFPLQAVAVVGAVGSGKSTLVAGIVGEAHVFPTRNYDSRNEEALRWQAREKGGREQGRNGREQGKRTLAPTRADTVCYAAQTPWVMSGTVRENVLFGLPMDEERYRWGGSSFESLVPFVSNIHVIFIS